MPKKCGIVVFANGQAQAISDTTPTEEESSASQLYHLQNQPIPVLEEYRYLGIVMNRAMDRERMIQDRVEKGRKCLYSIQPFLCTRSVPIACRARLFKAVVMPVITYGGEIFGMRQASARPLQTLANQAIRWMLGIKGDLSRLGSMECLKLELGIPDMGAVATRKRFRAHSRFGLLKTWIKILIDYPMRKSGYSTWVEGCRRWDARFRDSPTLFDDRFKRSEKVQYRAGKNNESWKQYEDAKLFASRQFSWYAIEFPEHYEGIHWLTLARSNYLPTCRRMAQTMRVAPQYLTLCPFCRQEQHGEDLYHMLLECPEWNFQRERNLRIMVTQRMAETVAARNSRQQSQQQHQHSSNHSETLSTRSIIDQFDVWARNDLGMTLSRSECSFLILGGEISDISFGWRWLKASKPQGILQEGSIVREQAPYYILVARFLGSVMRQRATRYQLLRHEWKARQLAERTARRLSISESQRSTG
jgi:hypothetical protein